MLFQVIVERDRTVRATHKLSLNQGDHIPDAAYRASGESMVQSQIQGKSDILSR
jgi:hypothetical protein